MTTTPTTPTSAPTPTPERYRAVLLTAADVLVARQDRMLTLAAWVALARAVAACHGVKTADLLGEADLEDIADRGLDWDAGADGPLPTPDAD